MSAHCCDHDTPKLDAIVNLARYRKILWIALVVNAAMFLVEIVALTTRAIQRILR